MAVTIEHGYTPLNTAQYVEYAYTVTVDSTYQAQLTAPVYYDGVMRFTGGDIYLTRNDAVCDMTSCEYTDTSNNVWRWRVEWDTDRYNLKYSINGGTPTIRDWSSRPIYFGWLAEGGAAWNDGVMPGYQANISCLAMYISAGGQTYFNTYSAGNVRVETRVTQSQDNRTYDVTETVTTT